MPPVGFEPTVSVDERPHTYALDRAATGTALQQFHNMKFKNSYPKFLSFK